MKAFNRIYAWFTHVGAAVDQHDGRDDIKIGVFAEALSDEEKAARMANDVKVTEAKDYLTGRDRYVLTCKNFKYVPAVSTNIRVTMRRYIEETMPEVKEAYLFLFKKQH